jgi:hypothetical protein
MSWSQTVLKGVVHGKTIELEKAPGLPEGQPVHVTIHPAVEKEKLLPGEGIRQSAGAWADDSDGLDKFLEWNRRQRKISRPEIASDFGF